MCLALIPTAILSSFENANQAMGKIFSLLVPFLIKF
jgi:hypothetical protein